MGKTTLKFIICALIAGVFILNPLGYAAEEETGRIRIVMSSQIDNSDVILTARLTLVTAPYKVRGKLFYEFQVDEIISGKLDPQSYLVIFTREYSSEGSPAIIEKDENCLLFLKKIDLSKDGLPEDITAYSLLGNWKGIMPLSSEASEQRFLQVLKADKGIDVESLTLIVPAIKAAIAVSEGELSADEEKTALPVETEVQEIIKKLHLEQYRKPAEPQPAKTEDDP